MFIDVKLLSGFPKPLTYQLPADWQPVQVGTLVRVPLRALQLSAIVIRIYETRPTDQTFAVKYATQIEQFPQDSNYLTFLKELSTYYQLDEFFCIKRLQSFLKDRKIQEPIITSATDGPISKTAILTTEQQHIVDALLPQIISPTYQPSLIHGVTGSGKTEIYKKCIEQAFLEQKTVVLLLPEVSLAIQFENILRQKLSSTIPIFSFHSATKPKLKQLLWQHLLENKPALIIGVHLPILLPIENLGLIIIDEEHEIGFQEKKHPKINTKQAALLRARVYNIPIILGSATPSIASLYNVQHRGWKLYQLKNRFAGTFPTIHTVSLVDKKQRKSFWITDQLLQALRTCLLKKEQSIVFLNRRGVCFFIQCKSCSFIISCNSCSVSLTLHADNTLRCHYCSYQQDVPAACSQCQKTEFLKKGIGTEQITTILKKLLPTARIGRADLDITANKVLWAQTITAFENQELDILVGTQTIAKGYHFPHVTLVGVIWADINLNFPFYNAQETTLQQLIQVAGRAGRQHNVSSVIIQTMTEQRIFEHLNEIDYLKFYENELERRAEVNYPPIVRFAEIELKHPKEATVEHEAQIVAAHLMNLNSNYQVLGPAKPPVAQIKKIFSRKIYLKADSFITLQNAFSSLQQLKLKSSFYYTPDPLN